MIEWKIYNITTSRDMDGVSLSKESCRFVEKERSETRLVGEERNSTEQAKKQRNERDAPLAGVFLLGKKVAIWGKGYSFD